jgi:hypothetical protein
LRGHRGSSRLTNDAAFLLSILNKLW